jgi:hypothetical protein
VYTKCAVQLEKYMRRLIREIPEWHELHDEWSVCFFPSFPQSGLPLDQAREIGLVCIVGSGVVDRVWVLCTRG